ncbi:hypothetical protein A6A08_25745 [Nocardiopsis sp. TSRI0078]|uniref:hypothetical protein n=1 Tax=unclassified Nocardiopsis TaxID=2649073 RepID=UPI0009389C3E|nr:hypothetical protein [Nocardiopsis sp. TSRI0078]OKI17544.1 hypothetical protein A6A08_25745 [Nocardiopsis sp. TSRI0078]
MVTRTKVAEYLKGAFDFGAINRRQVIVAADLRGAPEEVRSVLAQLPEGVYPDLRSLWPHLPGVERSA